MLLEFVLLFLFLGAVYTMPEMWIHGCQPARGDVVMGTHIRDDATTNKCNLSLSALGPFLPVNVINASLQYQISFRPNFGQVQIHCLLSATAGSIDVGSGYGHKDKCSQDGMSGVLWKGIGDPDGVTDIPFLYTPNVNQPNIKFAVTCSEGIGTPVYQHLLLIGNYTLPSDDIGSASKALAVVVLLMIILPITRIAIYCFWVKFKNRIVKGKALLIAHLSLPLAFICYLLSFKEMGKPKEEWPGLSQETKNNSI